jgi:ATP-dependent DNA ligase
MLYAFDLLEFNGKDLRPLPLGEHKAKLHESTAPNEEAEELVGEEVELGG